MSFNSCIIVYFEKNIQIPKLPINLLDYLYLYCYQDLHGYQISDFFHHHCFWASHLHIRHLRLQMIFIIVNYFLFYRALTANHFLRGKKSSANHFLRGRKSSANHFLRGRKFDRYARAAVVNHLFRGKKHNGDLRHSSLIKGEYYCTMHILEQVQPFCASLKN